MNLISFVITVTHSLGWHPQRSSTFAHIVASLFDQGNVQHHALIRTLPSTGATIKSQLERIRRFFAKQVFEYDELIKALVVQVFGKPPKMHLILDRTNWKHGKSDINYLVLAARVGKVVFPLFWTILDHQGTSEAQQRIGLLERFEKTFGFSLIRSFTADREFIGEKWLTYLYQNKIPFFIRLKDNRLVEWSCKEKKKLKAFFEHQTSDEERVLYKKINKLNLVLVGKKLSESEYLIVCSNISDTKKILKTYRQRWHIEIAFRNMKTQGFNIENTHMKSQDRLMKLMAAIAIAMLFACLLGLNQKCSFKKTVNSPLYSIFTRGFRFVKRRFNELIFQQLLRAATELLKSEG